MSNKGLTKELEEYEICGEDVSTQARTSPSEPIQTTPWVDPDDIKLKHRIGRGLFGDVWLATLHSSSEEFDEFHEVAAKILSFVSDDQVPDLLSKFYHVFQRCQSLKGVNWPRGVSRKNEKVCILTKFYEGSIGDKMARHKENRLSLTDVLRYGLEVALAVIQLHSVGILALNLKPCNFLLDDQDKAILGEFGIPMLLLGSSYSNAEAAVWLGTPNYMAPEQWSPDVRGPLSFETDSWGFACSIVEMLTGRRPWYHCSPEEIYSLTVMKREKPRIPNGLPPALARVLKGCFEYDYRKRPSFKEIVCAFESPRVIFKEEDLVHMEGEHFGKVAVVKTVVGPDDLVLQYFDKKTQLVDTGGIGKLSLWRNPFKVGDLVRLRIPLVSKESSELHKEIKQEGTITDIDTKACTILVKFSESQDPVAVNPAAIERVSSGFIVGDLVRRREGWPSDSAAASIRRSTSCVGVVHGIDCDGKLKVAFLGRERLCTCSVGELEKLEPFRVGQFVKLRSDVVSPRFQWPLRKDRRWDTGRIICIAPNGGLIVTFPGRIWNWDEWWADPEEVQVVHMNDYDNLADKYHHLEAIHWSVRPLAFVLVSFIAVKLGSGIVRMLPVPGSSRRKAREQREETKVELETDRQTEGKDAWLPPSVAKMLFRDGASVSH